jgi:threonine dehydratase
VPSEIPTLKDVTAAADRIRDVALTTPVVSSTSFSQLAGREVMLKAENLQRTGSFKVRGATNALALLSPEQRAAGVVAASAGNHAQGVALAARELGVKATVFMPTTAAIPKMAATRGYDAEVVLEGADLGEAVDAAMAHAAATGSRFIHPYDDPAIISGQGTLGLELVHQVPAMATAVIPIGGGGLISGSALAIKSLAPQVRVVGVHAAAVPTYAASRAAGRPTTVEVVPTVADGIAVGRPSEIAFELIEAHVDEIVTVPDDAATRAVAQLLERAKFLVEPSGAVTLAAVLAGLVDGEGPIVTVLSGGNIDLLLLGSLVRHGLETQGRFASFNVLVPDEPGQLASVLTTVGAMGANVLSADHHREGRGLAFGMVEIRLSVETKSDEHRQTLMEALRQKGIEVV